MTKKIESLATPNRRNRSLWLAFMTGVFLGVTAVSGVAQAQAQAPATGATAAQSVDDLGKLVGPIALYPDDLVAGIHQSAADRAGGSFSRQAQDRSQGAAR